MLIGLVSDSHGELANLKDAAWKLVHEWHVSCIAHLGDEGKDVQAIEDMRVEVIQVPGVYCQDYQNPRVPNRVIRKFEGHQVLFTHTNQCHSNDLPGDPNPKQLAREKTVDVVAYGHTHTPEALLDNGVVWVNPGHLKDTDKKGYQPSYGVLDLGEGTVRVLLIDLKTGEIFDSCSLEG